MFNRLRPQRWAQLSLLVTLSLLIALVLSACGETATTAPATTAASSATTAASTTTAASAATTAAGSATTAASAATTAASTSTKTLAPANLTIWATGSEDDGKVLQSAADAFSAAHPGVKVTVQPVSWDDAHAKILSAVTSGTGPDMITGGLSYGIEFGQKGGVVDLKAKYPDLVTQIQKQAQPGIYNSLVTTDGKVYAVPSDLTVFLMYYRTDVLQQAGISQPPATWDEMLADVQKLQAAGHKGLGINWGNKSWLGYFNYLYQAGGSLYDSQCTKATVDSPEGLKALQYYTDFYTKYKTSTDDNFDPDAGLSSADYPIVLNGNWDLTSLDNTHPEIKGKWAVAPLPAGPSGKRTAFIGGRAISIMNNSKAQDQAAEFIRYLYSDEAAGKTSQMAASLNAIWLPPRSDEAAKIQIPADRVQAIQSQLKEAAGPPVCTGWEESSSDFDKKIQGVILNGADPKQTLTDMANEMNQNLKG